MSRLLKVSLLIAGFFIFVQLFFNSKNHFDVITTSIIIISGISLGCVVFGVGSVIKRKRSS